MKRFLTIGALTILATLCGCIEREQSVTHGLAVTHIADRVECDLQSAYEQLQPNYPWMKYWAASFNLTIKQEDILGASPSVGYRVPITGNSQFGLESSFGVTTTGTRTLTTKRTVLLKNLKKYRCDDIVVDGSPLTHNLGLFRPLDDALAAYNKGDVINKEPDDLGYRIDFDLKVGGHADPLFILRRFTGVGVDFTGSSEKTNSLEIAFADARPKAPQEVFVVNFPSGGAGNPMLVPGPRKVIGSRLPASGNNVTPDVRLRLDTTLQRLQLETLLPKRF